MRSLRALGRLARPHIAALVVSTALLALHALTSGAYAYLAGPVLKFVYSGGDTAGSRISWLLERLGVGPGTNAFSLTAAIATVVVLLVLFKGLLYFAGSYLVVVAGQNMEHELRARLHGHALRIAYARLAELQRGDVVSRFLYDCSAVKYAVTHGLANLIRDALQVVVLAAVAVSLDPVLGLLALTVLPVSSLLILRLGARLRVRRHDASDAYGELGAAIDETTGALVVVRAFGAEAHVSRRFEALSRAVLRRNLQAWALQIFSSPLMELLGAAALAATLWYAGARIGSGALEPEAFVSFFAAIFLLYRPVKTIGEATSQVYSGLAALDRVDEVLALPTEPPDPPGAEPVRGIERSIRLEDVTFAYGVEPVLAGATLEIPAGRTVALVGPSGSGKTTVAMLLLRLIEPASGRVTIDGRDVRELGRASVRGLFGLVTQEPVLIHDSVEANVLFGLDRDRAAVEAAARAAGAHAFVSALTEGYETDVGEGGSRLSGGERQRLCIARALLRDPPALILDEATASIDSATEAEIAEALERLMEGRTTLLISHRLSTVRRADRIVVLRGGRIVAEGSFEELRERSEEFRETFRDQLSAWAGPDSLAGDAKGSS